MPSGIFGATITNLTPGTTIVAADVLSSLNSLKSNGLNNDGALIQTDGSGNIITPVGRLRGFFSITPYHMFTNPTLNSGTTRTDTYTGGSTGVPSGAIAVLLGIGIFAVTANAYLQIYPAGGTAGQGPGITGVGTAYTIGSCVCPVNGSGQITLKANGGNIVLQDWYIYGYIA